jgi:hypothetical protein
MNERIEKLIEQCTVQEFSDCTGGFETFDKVKFAELIVRECMDIAYDHTPNTEECEYKRLIHNKIKQHFGVEE